MSKDLNKCTPYIRVKTSRVKNEATGKPQFITCPLVLKVLIRELTECWLKAM